MSRHDAAQARTDVFAERIQLHAVQPGTVMPQHRQSAVRIGTCVTMPGKMLGHGQHTAAFQSPAVGQHFLGHSLRVFTKGTHIYHGIERVGIDIGHGGKIDMNA